MSAAQAVADTQYVIWEKGVGSTVSIGSSGDLDRNKTEVLRESPACSRYEPFLIVRLPLNPAVHDDLHPTTCAAHNAKPPAATSHTLARAPPDPIPAVFFPEHLAHHVASEHRPRRHDRQPAVQSSNLQGGGRAADAGARVHDGTTRRAGLPRAEGCRIGSDGGEGRELVQILHLEAGELLVRRISPSEAHGQHRKEDFQFILGGITSILEEHMAVQSGYLPGSKRPVPYILETCEHSNYLAISQLTRSHASLAHSGHEQGESTLMYTRWYCLTRSVSGHTSSIQVELPTSSATSFSSAWSTRMTQVSIVT